MKVTREQHKGIIEHDYHQMAFSRDTYLNELMQNQKLRGLIESKSKKRSNGCDGSERDCPTCDEINVCKELLKESKK